MRRHFIWVLAMTQVALAEPGDQPPSAGNGIRIAVVQQDGNPGKPEENRNKAVGFARQALERGAEVVLFHEEMLLGCVTNVSELAEPLEGGYWLLRGVAQICNLL